MGDRINRVSIGKFDQILALTQHMINTGLQGQWDWAASEGFGEPQNVVMRRSGNQGFYDTVFGAPRVIVNATIGDRSSCTFRMLIKSGKLKVYYYKAEDENDAVTSYDLRNFSIACPVNVALTGLNKNEPDYERIRRLMNKPGDYSIKQLLVDFQSAQTRVLNTNNCDFGVWTENDWVLKDIHQKPKPNATPTKEYWRPDGWEKGKKREIGPEVTKNLQSLFSQSLDTVMSKAAAGQLGFTADASDTASTGHEPTFVPTDVRFQTYPYQDEDGRPVEAGLDGKGQLNYLLYLEMTDDRSPPIGDDEFLNANGNWTNGTDPNTDGIAEFGTYVLSRQNFMERWFVPKLKKINRIMSAAFYGLSMHFDANIVEWSATFSFPILVGDNCKGFDVADKQDDAYALTYSASPPKDFVDMAGDAFSAPAKGAMCWYYSKTPFYIKDKFKSSISSLDRSAISDCCSRFTISPGSNKMTLEGYTRLQFGFVVDPSFLDHNVYSQFELVVTWKLEFTMTEVSDGGLAVHISDPEVNYDWKKEANGWTNSNTGTRADTKGLVNGRFDHAKHNLGNLVHEMKNALEGNDKFFFPPRGRFFFKDPMFNHNGDLVSKCAYNGAETGNANPDTNAKRDTSRPRTFNAVTGVTLGGSSGS